MIEPDTGAVLPDGALDELAFTSLSKEAFLIIRYRPSDLTRLLPGTARSEDMIILRGKDLIAIL